MPDKDPFLWPPEDDDNRVVVAPGQAAFFPEGSKEVQWRDETDPRHQANFTGPEPACSCGWTGPSWVVHYTSVKQESK